MAIFNPDIQIGYGTDFAPEAGKRVIKAEDGTIAIMNYYGTDVFNAKIECPFATEAEFAEIEAFYEDNRNVPWTFVNPADGFTYTLFFTNRPHVNRVESAVSGVYFIVIEAIGYRA